MRPREGVANGSLSLGWGGRRFWAFQGRGADRRRPSETHLHLAPGLSTRAARQDTAIRQSDGDERSARQDEEDGRQALGAHDRVLRRRALRSLNAHAPETGRDASKATLGVGSHFCPQIAPKRPGVCRRGGGAVAGPFQGKPGIEKRIFVGRQAIGTQELDRSVAHAALLIQLEAGVEMRRRSVSVAVR